jgi:hypothetical protein
MQVLDVVAALRGDDEAQLAASSAFARSISSRIDQRDLAALADADVVGRQIAVVLADVGLQDRERLLRLLDGDRFAASAFSAWRGAFR